MQGDEPADGERVRAERSVLAGRYRATTGGRLVDADEELARLLGYDSREALLATGRLPAPHGGREALLGLLRQRGAEAGAETTLTRRDGSPVQVIFSEHLTHDAGGEPLVEGTVVDVSSRQRDEVCGRLLSTMASGVAHRITEPLSSLVANIGFALEQVGAVRTGGVRREEAVDELDRALGDARRGAEAIRLAVRDLAVFAGPTDGGAPLADLTRTVSGTLSTLSGALLGRARLELQLAETPPVAVRSAVLARCLLHLLVDALEAMVPDDGEHLLRLVTRTEGRRAVAEITDTGRHDGCCRATRLGVLACRMMVSSMRGSMAVEALPGRGQRLTLELPAA